MNAAVVGNGKLGICLTLLLAEAGLDVIAVDTNPEVLSSLRQGKATHYEADLQEMLDDHGHRVNWCSEVADAADADVVFVVVPTPSLPSGAFDVSAVENVASLLADHTTRDDAVVCVVSTTNPGDCAGSITEAAQPLPVVFQPEFVALGDVFAGMRRPDLLLIGESHSWAGDRVAHLLRSVRAWGPRDLHPGQLPVQAVASQHRLTLTEAEIAKLYINSMVTQKISAANSLGDLRDRYEARPYLVAAAVGSDSRIGRAYFRPGPPYGGPCFPRDQKALQVAAEKVGVDVPLSHATEEVNLGRADVMAARIRQQFGIPLQVAVLGLSYKPGTAVTTEAFGGELAECLWSRGFDVSTYDPLVKGTHDSIDEAIDGAHLVIVATDEPDFRRPYPVPVLDVWGCM